MNAIASECLKTALSLPHHERATIADTLLLSLGDEDASQIVAAWQDEIGRRIVAGDAGEAKHYDWDEVLSGLQ